MLYIIEMKKRGIILSFMLVFWYQIFLIPVALSRSYNQKNKITPYFSIPCNQFYQPKVNFLSQSIFLPGKKQIFSFLRLKKQNNLSNRQKTRAPHKFILEVKINEDSVIPTRNPRTININPALILKEVQ